MKFKWPFGKEKTFRKIGWVFLVLGLLGIYPYIYSFYFLIFSKEAQNMFLSDFNGYSVYQKIVVILPLILKVALSIWQIVISIILIKNNKYIKQILYYIYGLILIDLISFVLYLPFKQFLYMELLMAGITWWVLIKQDNSLSSWIKGK